MEIQYCFKSPRIYGDFIRELADRGMLGFRRGFHQPLAALGIFFVREKDGKFVSSLIHA